MMIEVCVKYNDSINRIIASPSDKTGQCLEDDNPSGRMDLLIPMGMAMSHPCNNILSLIAESGNAFLKSGNAFLKSGNAFLKNKTSGKQAKAINPQAVMCQWLDGFKGMWYNRGMKKNMIKLKFKEREVKGD